MLSLLFSLLFVCGCFSSRKPDSMDFIVIGDWGGLPYPPYHTDIELGISRKLMTVANSVKLDFLLALGDNFYYNGVENEFDSRFRTSFEEVFNSSDLFFPWYFIAGNHDWRGNVSAQIAYTSHSTRWKFPNYFYTIEETLPGASEQRMAIIMIDTVVLCRKASSDFDDGDTFTPLISDHLTNIHWKFIQKELMRVQRYAYIIVAGHYPVWSIGHHGPTKCLVKRLDPLLKEFNVSAYINGHDHTIEHIQIPYGRQRSMNYFTIGAANFMSNSMRHKGDISNESLKFHWNNVNALGGFALMSVTSQFMKVDFLSTEGVTLYTTKVKPRN